MVTEQERILCIDMSFITLRQAHTLAIAANLGWYLSMTDQEWPFGLTNSNIDNAKLKQAFSKYFLLMLGRADTSTKPNTPYVADHWDIINLQGEHRLG